MNEEKKDLEYWRKNCEENYITTPISVLRYIIELEKATEVAINTEIIGNVSDLFSFANYLEENYDYHDNTVNGDVYFRKGDKMFTHYTKGIIYLCWQNNS